MALSVLRNQLADFVTSDDFTFPSRRVEKRLFTNGISIYTVIFITNIIITIVFLTLLTAILKTRNYLRKSSSSRNRLIGDGVLVEPSMCKKITKIKHMVDKHVSICHSRWYVFKKLHMARGRAFCIGERCKRYAKDLHP